MKKFKIKTFVYTWQYFINHNMNKMQYFIFGYKPYHFINKKLKITSLDNKLDLINWFLQLQEDNGLEQFIKPNEQMKFSSNFELYLGKSDVDITRTFGSINTRLLDEIFVKNKIHKLERDILVRHLIFFFLLQKNNLYCDFSQLHHYTNHLNLLINLDDLKTLNNANQLFFILNTKHLSNKKLQALLLQSNSRTSASFYHKQSHDSYQLLSEHITLFDLNENETQLPLSGTVDRILQESDWQGRYRILPTIVKNLDSPEEYITRLGMNSYKANINSFDYKWWDYHHTISSYFMQSINTSTTLINPLDIGDTRIHINSIKDIFATFNRINLLFTGIIDYSQIKHFLCSSTTLFNKNTFINYQLWYDFNTMVLALTKWSMTLKQIVLYETEKFDINMSQLIFNLKKLNTIKVNYTLTFYKMPYHSMLQHIFIKFKNLFFLRASIGANWGFFDVNLLQEEQDKNEKNKYYQQYDDDKKFYYFLNPKDTPGFDDTTAITDVKYKRFVDDVYNPILVKPHKRPYNWLQIPEFSFSPFFLFLKNSQFLWYTVFDFNFNLTNNHIKQTPLSSFELVFTKIFKERFINSQDFTYTYWLKFIFSRSFLQQIFSDSMLLSIFFTFNMETQLIKVNSNIVNEKIYTPLNDFSKINNALHILGDSFFLPNSLKNQFIIKNAYDIYAYNNYFLSGTTLDTNLKIEQRKANQMRFNFMFKLGLSREHSWFFLYQSPQFFKQTITYQSWIKNRIPNVYAWEHDNPFLIQQIFRPYSLDLTQDISLYKYKADMLHLLLLGFRDIVFSDLFLVKNYYTQKHKSRSIFEIPQYTIPFFLLNSDLYSITRIPETVIYEHISAFGIPALERQWDFHEITIDLLLNKQTSAWPNYLFNSKAYAKVLWTSRSTKQIFNLQEYDMVQAEKNKNLINNNRVNYSIFDQFNHLKNRNKYKIYSYLFTIIYKNRNINILLSYQDEISKLTNENLKQNYLFIVNQLKFLQQYQIQNQYQQQMSWYNSTYLFVFYEQYYIYNIVFSCQTFNLNTYVFRLNTANERNDFYVVYFIFLYIIYCLKL